MAQGGNHGGGSNNSNKREKRGAAATAPTLLHKYPSPNKPAGAAHLTGTMPAPDEPTKRPVRR